MKPLSERKKEREARASYVVITDENSEYVNSDARLPELLAHSNEIDAKVADDRLTTEANKAAALVGDSLKARGKVAKRADTAATDPTDAAATQIKRQGAQSAESAPGAWTANA